MILFLLVSALVLAYGWHKLARPIWLAIIGSTVTSVLLNWFVLSSHIGVVFLEFDLTKWDQYFVRNILIVFGVSLAASVGVGMILRRKAK